MDQESLEYGMEVLDEMGEALKPISMTVEKLDPAETGGLPTGLIRPQGTENGWTVICTVVPTHHGEVSTTFVQLSVPLTAPCPERQQELERYGEECNRQFQMGTLTVFQASLHMKYTIVLEPTVAMEEAHIQAAVFAFCQQAETLAHWAQGICQGTMTVEEAMTARDG